MVDNSDYRPLMSDAGISSLHTTKVVDEHGQQREVALTGERPLTIYLDKLEIVTLMTMGAQPELLTLGYLLNQGLIHSLKDVIAIQVEWDVDAVSVTTEKLQNDVSQIIAKRTVTSGCGQGTMFGNVMEKLDTLTLACPEFSAMTISKVLDGVTKHNQVYKQAGAVHGCALCTMLGDVDLFVEDVGRHNAVDAISGWMLLHSISGEDKVFYTTGRLTSEMVIKVAQMQVPLLLSRSGITEMGLSIAKNIGIGLVARAKGKHFLVFNGLEHFHHSS